MKFPRAFACYNKNLGVRLQSTSGGIFTVLAEYVIKQLNGLVIGCSFNEEFEVVHSCIKSLDELSKLRGSKYPQSYIGNIYREVKEYLILNKTVLFVGTPCQVSGLLNFLNFQYSNLICIDFVCHGTASPILWKNYLNDYKELGSIKDIVFKDKIKGWKKWHIKFVYENKTEYTRGYMDPFMRSYLTSTNIRPSCYNCRFKGIKHESDFTISDCWGLGESNTRLNDDKGLSAFLIQSEVGWQIFNKIQFQLVYQEYEPNQLMNENFTTFRSVTPSSIRDDFFSSVYVNGPKLAFKKYFVPKFTGWCKYYFLRIIGKEK